MNRNMTAALLAALMVGFALAPLTTAVPSKDCSTQEAAADPDNPEPCATLAGPASVDVKGVVSAGIGFCQSEVPGAPVDCGANPGTISAAGAYVHDATACAGSATCEFEVWAQQTGGADFGGFSIVVCTDRDDDDICTNVTSQVDQFAENGYCCSTLAGTKDHKDDDVDWEYAHTTICALPDVATAGGDYDDVTVFIAAWVSENIVFGGNLGEGASVGTFDVWVEINGGGCTATPPG